VQVSDADLRELEHRWVGWPRGARVLFFACFLCLSPVLGAEQIETRIEELRSADPEARSKAARHLALLKEKATPAVPALVQALDDDDDDVRYIVVYALREIPHEAKLSVGPLERCLTDPSWRVRFGAAEALATLGEGGTPAASALAEALGEDEVPAVRTFAAFALGEIGPRAAPAIPSVIRALHDDGFEDVRAHAAKALGKIGADLAITIPALGASLNDYKPSVQLSAIEALEKLGPHAISAVPSLVGALEADRPRWLRARAGRLLARFGPQAVPALVAALEDEREGVSEAAAEVLRKIGRPALPGVIASVRSKGDDSVHRRKVLGIFLKDHGVVLWWVVPRAYLPQLIGLLLALIVWFLLARNFQKDRSISRRNQLAYFVLVTSPPAGLAWAGALHVVTREWAQGFLPDLPSFMLPSLPVVTILSVVFLMAIAGAWASRRKSEPA